MDGRVGVLVCALLALCALGESAQFFAGEPSVVSGIDERIVVSLSEMGAKFFFLMVLLLFVV